MSQSDVIIKTKVLQQIPYSNKFRVSRDVMLTSEYDFDFNQYVVELETRVAAEELAADVYYGYRTVSTPRSTFQMFKDTNKDKWWFSWFVSRYPVAWNNQILKVGVEVKRYLKYPEANVDFKALGRPVRLEMLSETPERYR